MTDNATPHNAAAYDRDVIRTIPCYTLFHSETIDLVRTLLPEVSVWLDTGCGTGYLVEQALPLLPQTSFLLADPSSAMLDQARERLSRFPSGRIRFLGAFPTDELTPAIAGNPQVITAIQSHHYSGDTARRRATETCFRLLASGGVYVTFENIRPDTARGTDTALERWCRFQRAAGRSDQIVAEHRARFDKNYFPITVAEHLALLRATGFPVAETFWLSYMQAGFYAIK
jgi:tRNA (cmo5U34)-methyltransferase